MKLLFTFVTMILFNLTYVQAQLYMDKEFQLKKHFENGKTVYILRPSQEDALDILDKDESVIGREINELKQVGEKPYMIRLLHFFDDTKTVTEKHELIASKGNVRYSTYYNREQQVIRQEQWKDGTLTYRSFTDPQTGETKTDQIILPSPNGGIKAWNTYISQNLRYPKEAMNRYSGTVHISFEVDPSGKVKNVEVVNAEEVHQSFSKEAIRLISKYKGGWQPHSINGEAVTSTLTFPIVFQMAF